MSASSSTVLVTQFPWLSPFIHKQLLDASAAAASSWKRLERCHHLIRSIHWVSRGFQTVEKKHLIQEHRIRAYKMIIVWTLSVCQLNLRYGRSIILIFLQNRSNGSWIQEEETISQNENRLLDFGPFWCRRQHEPFTIAPEVWDSVQDSDAGVQALELRLSRIATLESVVQILCSKLERGDRASF